MHSAITGRLNGIKKRPVFIIGSFSGIKSGEVNIIFIGGAYIDKVRTYDELKAIKESLEKPFLYHDTDKVQEDFYKELSEEDILTADLNSYWMNIVGSLSYVLGGIPNKIPQGQIEWLHLSFFDIFQQYRFFEDKVADYPSFYEEYINNEKARKLLLDYLSYN